MNIPIDNIYFLLSYAWDKLDEKDRVEVDTDGITDQLDLFAKILINASRILLKRGIEHNYIEETADIPSIKGKFLVSQSIKSNILHNYRAICQFDSYSPNVLINQILITTLNNLVYAENIDPYHRDEIKFILWQFPEINKIQLNESTFKRIRLTRNNRFYGFILDICQLIFQNLLPSEQKGKYKFVDFTRDEVRMYRLFEHFVFNFYSIEMADTFRVKRDHIQWDFIVENPDHLNYVPGMLTDITLENTEKKIIIDTKYYQETMSERFESRKIKSANLYQLFSYLINQHDGSERNNSASGILLYPTIDEEYNLEYKHKEHKIFIRTLNLNKPWPDIRRRLFEIVDYS